MIVTCYILWGLITTLTGFILPTLALTSRSVISKRANIYQISYPNACEDFCGFPECTDGDFACACQLSQLQLESQCAACINAQPTGYTAVNGTALSPVDYMTYWFTDCADAGYTFDVISSSLYPASTGRASMGRSVASATPTTRASPSSQVSGRVRSTALPSQAASPSDDRGTVMPTGSTNGAVVRDAASTRWISFCAVVGMLAILVIC